ncbi:MAG: hypothetical protein AAFP19_05745 [Bacteroidota bacterium]
MTKYELLPDTTRVWIYQSNRPFTDKELPTLRQHLAQFTTQWVSHSQQLRAFGEVYHQRFIVLMVDESQAGASGCSIDSSVHFIKAIEQHYSTNLFDRMNFAYQEDGEVRMASREEFARLYQEGKISDETLVFDNLVKNKGEFEQQWLRPLAESWHARMV